MLGGLAINFSCIHAVDVSCVPGTSNELASTSSTWRPGWGHSRFEKKKFSALRGTLASTPSRVRAFNGNGRSQNGNLSENSDIEESSVNIGGALRGAREEASFVRWFREAWPYIQGHRGSTFVIVIPGEVSANPTLLDLILQDVALMHGLGVKIVLVPGIQPQIDEQLREQGLEPVFSGAYRVTDAEALEAAMEASGRIRVNIEAKLSRGPVIPVLRRHGESEKWHDVGINVASGNFVFAKRRGVIQGTDFGATGDVKKVDVERIKNRLDSGCIVLLTNLGFCPTGEVLNCNTYEVATLCATAIKADKLICLIDGPVVDSHGRLIRWMTLQQADIVIREKAAQSYTATEYIKAVAGAEYAKSLGLPSSNTTPAPNGMPAVSQNGSTSKSLWVDVIGKEEASKESKEVESESDDAEASRERWNMQRALYTMNFEKPKPVFSSKNGSTGNGIGVGARNGSSTGNGNGNGNGKKGFAVGGSERSSAAQGYLSELTAAVFACRGGVRRVHLLDCNLEGSLLLELYTRDGIGTMVSSDLYEGTRAAQLPDIRGIQALLLPLEEAGVLVPRSEERLVRELPYFTVVERDGHIIACAALFPFAEDKAVEIAAFAVSPAARGHGRGDNLLAYLEQRAQDMGMQRLFLLTTRTADWFVQRGFAPCPLINLPKERYDRIDQSRGSKSFMKSLCDDAHSSTDDQIAALPTDLPQYGPAVQ